MRYPTLLAWGVIFVAVAGLLYRKRIFFKL